MGAAGRAEVKRTLDEHAVLGRWQDAFDRADRRFVARTR